MFKKSILLLIIGLAILNGENRLNERYHTYEEIRDSLFAWDEEFGQNSNPSEHYTGSGIIYHLEEIGTSTNDGLPFWGVRLSFNADQKQDKPRVLILGQCHAEEILGVEITMDIISKFLHPEDNQDLVFNMGALLYFSEIWLVPTHNPEGLRVVHGYEENGVWIQDDSYRKNKRDVNLNNFFDFEIGVGNDSDGVDLNRNYDFNWVFGDGPYEYDNGHGGYQSHYDYYKGEAPFSENEIQAIRDFAFREDFLLSIAYHSSRSGFVAEKVIYSWNWDDEKPSPDFEVVSELGIEIAERIIREDGGGGYLPVSNGSRKGNAHDWFYSQVGTIQFLIEVGTQNMQPDDVELIEDTIDRNLNGAFYLMNRAAGFTQGDYGAPANQVSGIVTDEITGNLIVGAQVKILEMDGEVLNPRLTDEFGRFRRLLSNGSYTVQVMAEGYYSNEVSINSSSGTITNRDIQLTPRQEFTLDINLHLPEDLQPTVFVDVISELATNTFVLSDGLNSLQLYADSYQLKVYGEGLFTRFFNYNLSQNSLHHLTMNPAEIIFEEDFSTLQNWNILHGDWNVENGRLVSQSSFTYDDGALGEIQYNGEINIPENSELNLILDLKNEFEWEHDYAYFDFDSNNENPEYLVQNHNWDMHQIEIPIENFNQFVIGMYADSTVSYRGLEIDNMKLVSQPITIESISENSTVPHEFKINKIFPNPFNPTTIISYQIPKAGNVKIEVYNLLGQVVETLFNDFVNVGNHEIKWNPTNLSNGIYIVKALYSNQSTVQKVLFLK